MSFLDTVDPPPLRTVELKDESVGLDAVVVIDHDLFPRSAGGTRMVADVTTDEVARLARAMTWKLAVAERPLAGAKAGVRFTGGDRDAVLTAFLDRAAEIDGFLTGPDIGTHPDDFAAVVTDLTMPKMTGTELAKAIHGIRPRLPVLLTSGYSGAIDEEHAARSGFSEILSKPFAVRSLSEALHRAIHSDGQS